MKSKKCKVCGKVVEGYSQKHVDYLMLQHGLIHRKDNLSVENKDTPHSFLPSGSKTMSSNGGVHDPKEERK